MPRSPTRANSSSTGTRRTRHASDDAASATPKRTRARRGEGERLRDEILDATIELLVETGDADKVSTRAVARRVGCTSPALYLHFSDKASMLYAACECQFDKLSAVLADAVADIDDPIERLRAAAVAYGRFAVDHPQEYRVMMLDLSPASMYEGDLASLATSPGFEAIVRAIQDGIDQGVLRPVDPYTAALLLWGGVHGLVSLVLVKPGLELPPIDELLAANCALIIDGLRASANG